MKKINFLALAIALLVSGSMWADIHPSYVEGTDEASVTVGSTTSYATTLLDAFEFANGKTATIAMMKNVEHTASALVSITINEASDWVWNLKGKTVTFSDYQIYLDNGKLSVDSGLIVFKAPVSKKYQFFMVCGTNVDMADYSVLTIGANLEVQAPGYAACIPACSAKYVDPELGSLTCAMGAVINVYGFLNDWYGMTVNGSIVVQTGNIPQINIYEGAHVPQAIYGAGYAKYHVYGGSAAEDYMFEVRAGELTIDGGTFTNPSTKGVSFTPEGAGSTVSGGCSVGLSQHTTKLPIIVNINGGTFTATNPIAQGNPQENDEASLVKVSCNINGGFFKSTAATPKTIITQDKKRVYVKGGYFNDDPVAYVATGYMSIKLADIVGPSPEDQAAMEAGYTYKVGLVSAGDADESKADGDWSDDAETVWKAGQEPASNTPITIDGQNIVVTTPAEAYSVALGTASATKLTVKDGGTLVVGSGGISGATASNFIVEDGGVLVIAPNQDETNPVGTVKYIAKWAGLQEGVTEATKFSDVFWEQFAIPTVGAPASFAYDDQNGTGFNAWNLMSGWQKVNKSAINTPFTGYFLRNTTPYSASAKSGAENTYTFTGTMVGNKVNTMVFAREGFTFFGNSYTAPIGIAELLKTLNKDNVQATIYLYKPLDNTYRTINMATVGRFGNPSEIEPMQGFFVYAVDAANIDPSYKEIVWDAIINKLSTPTAPARRNALQSEFSAAATLSLAATNGQSDELVVLERSALSNDFDQNYDAKKLMNTNNLNIFVPRDMDYAVYATADLAETPITIVTSDDILYTITFGETAGQLVLFDAVANKSIAMTEGAAYSFTAQANSTITNRFSIRKITNVTTEVENVEVNVAARGIYTLTGMYVGEESMWNALPQGLYIVNGQKIVK